MTTKTIGKFTVDTDENGYMTDINQWNENIAKELAKEVNIELTENHLKVLHFLRDSYKKGDKLSIRKIGKSGIVSVKEFYSLFPDGPLKKAAFIAGIPKPSGCV